MTGDKSLDESPRDGFWVGFRDGVRFGLVFVLASVPVVALLLLLKVIL